jgi:glycosyltransferase involved in cell wall biosynthesis
MSVSSARVSVVVPTLERTTELTRLMESLLVQEFKDFEVIVVDQNSDDRIVPVLEPYQPKLRITRIRMPRRRGISSGKNDGWRKAGGEVVVFPDDDCWYPPWFLRKGLELIDATGAELVSGRFADERGRSINGRFASRAQVITRRSVWIAQSEAATFYRRDLLERVGGFDETLGIGAASPWQAAEGPDVVLKALQIHCVCCYDPTLFGFHREFDLDDPSGGMTRKGRAYGRGMGYVLRRHRFGVFSLLQWVSRPLVTALMSVACGRFNRAAYSLSVSLGRIEGWWQPRSLFAVCLPWPDRGMVAKQQPMKILIGIATIGRPLILSATLAMIVRQTRAPDAIFIAPTSDADLKGVDLDAIGASRIVANAGLCAQRNAILAAAANYDIIVFFDDDFFPCKDYLAAVEQAFLEEPNIVMTSGSIIADGVSGPGITIEMGRCLVENAERINPAKFPRRARYNGYGCNMAFRLAMTRQGLTFDDTLPQYSWLEDVDFSRRIASYGRIVTLRDARGVHLGTKSGRTAGIKYGYSQIANPIYMVRKGTFSWPRAAEQMARNIVMNSLRSLRPEPYIDRRGRLRGNIAGLIDALRGRVSPGRINLLT